MLKTSEGKWVLFDVATGAQAEFWPIDARLLLDAGSHSTEAPTGVAVSQPQSAPRRVGVPKTAVAKHAEADELREQETSKPDKKD